MSILAINTNYTPIFAPFYKSHKLFYTIETLLYINVRHNRLVKILYFIINIHSEYLSINNNICQYNMRVELESKALGFQPKESGAVPTNTHQKELYNGTTN